MSINTPPDHLYKRISLEFISTFPGQVYLRFEPLGKTPAFMIQVMPADIVNIAKLGDPYTVIEADEIIEASKRVDEMADDDFRPGDSG